MTHKTYSLSVTRDGRWWIIDAPEIGHRTQAHSLVEAEEMGRDLIASALDIPSDSFDVDMQVEKPADVMARLADAEARDRDAREAVSLAARDRRDAVRLLREVYGLSVIDAARILGVTRARVYQLLDDRERETA